MPGNKGTKSKRPKAKFYYHIPPKEEKTSTDHRYIHYTSKLGGTSTTTSWVQTPCVMHQPDNASEIQSETIPGSSLDDCGDNDYEIPIDPAYLNHIEEQQDFETMEKAKRVRSKGVLHISPMTHQLLTP